MIKNTAPLFIILFLMTLVFGCDNEQATATESAKSSAQANVLVLPQSFAMPDLNRTRQIRMFLPANYGLEQKHYPVIYMHDAQNLFDDVTSYVGEWKVDETLNRLAKTHQLNLIVVGIDNGQEKRMNELSAWDHTEYGVAEGKQYLAFITDVIKPYIDAHYRTKPDAPNTAIMGSSMGGLMSFYAIHSRPDVFSKAGVFSPSFWYAPETFAFAKRNPLPKSARVDFLIGSKEGDEVVNDMQKMLAILKLTGHPESNIKSKVVVGAEHNETFWSAEFADSVLWLFGEK